MAEATATKRTRVKAEYLIQTKMVNIESGWGDMHGSFDDTAAALAHIRSAELEGQFRIIAVKRVVTAEKKTKSSIVFK